jgi:hypothetical protein
MKKTLLILVMLLAGFAGFAQTELERVSESFKTVKDTSYSNDERLTFMVNTILPAVNNYFENYNAKTKVNGEAVTFQAQTTTFVQGLNNLIYSYAQNFIQITQVQVDSSSIVAEFNALNQRITTLQQDPDIKYLEAMREFQEIQERQAKLAKYYDQLITTVKPVVKDSEWVKPTGTVNAYKKGARVTYSGKTWESLIDANQSTPGVSDWKEIIIK